MTPFFSVLFSAFSAIVAFLATMGYDRQDMVDVKQEHEHDQFTLKTTPCSFRLLP